MQWTKSQSDTIEARGKALIVSAGAGSGKTSVLTERIIRLLTEGADIDSFLVVTYTRASAADMKGKIYTALNKASALDPSNKHLIKQLNALSGASISTIHSFCLNMIKQNFHVLGLPPKIRPADDGESKIMLFDSMVQISNALLEDGDTSFSDLFENFSTPKNEDGFFETMSKTYQRLRAFPDFFEILEKESETLVAQAKICKTDGVYETENGKLIFTNTLEALETLSSDAEYIYMFTENNISSQKYIDSVYATKEAVDAFVSCVKSSYNAGYEAAGCFKLPSLAGGKAPEDEVIARTAIKDKKAEIKSNADEIIKTLFSCSTQQIIDDYASTKYILDEMIYFLRLVDETYMQKKKKLGVLDFLDMERMALTLLLEKTPEGGYIATDYCKSLRNTFNAIFIDEYQDINPLQDLIFSAIAKDNNRFMVGDVKQSIYKFRNAYPDIFESYKKAFTPYPSPESGNKIFLRENFRCSKSVIAFVNHIFSQIYTPKLLGASYEGEELIYAKNSGTEYPVKVLMFSESEYEDENGNVDKSFENEAEYIAREIKSLKTHFIKENGEKLKYGDIAILLSTVRNVAPVFEGVLKRECVPVYSEKGTPFFEASEVLLLMSFLKCVDNPQDDISLAAIMRSPIYTFTANDIYLIRQGLTAFPLYDSVCAYAAKHIKLPKNKFTCSHNVSAIKPFVNKKKAQLSYSFFKCEKRNKPLAQKCGSFLRDLREYRKKASLLPNHKLIWQFFEDKSYLALISQQNGGEKRRANAIAFYERARDFEKNAYRTLTAFNDYIDELATENEITVPANENASDAVRIMTIHKSKGLEFPVVFLADSSHAFMSMELNDSVLVHRERGVYFALRDHGGMVKRDTFLRKGLSVTEKKLLYQEEARKLYVALTRAREKLYVTATFSNPEKLDEKPFAKRKSYIEWIAYALGGTENIPIDEAPGEYLPCSSDESINTSSTVLMPREDILYKYPFENDTHTPKKLSVSEIREGILEDDEYSRNIRHSNFNRTPSFLSKDFPAGGSEKGTANHLFMQFASFDNVDSNGAEHEAKRLLDTEMLSARQHSLLSFIHLKRFFCCNLYKAMRASKHIYREKRFSVTNGNTLIQGVIDCFFENEDGTYTVVDYKTDYITRGQEQMLIDRHKTQLSYYCRAVEMITGKKVTKVYLYSFAIDSAIEIKI